MVFVCWCVSVGACNFWVLAHVWVVGDYLPTDRGEATTQGGLTPQRQPISRPGSHFGLSHIDMAPTRALQRKVSQLFRMRGWQLRPDAMQRLYELLNGEDDWE